MFGFDYVQHEEVAEEEEDGDEEEVPPNLPHPAGQFSLYRPHSPPPPSIPFRDCDATSPALYKMSSVSGAGRIKWTAKKFLFQLWSLLQLLLSLLLLPVSLLVLFRFISFSLACFISLLIIFSL